MNKKDAIKLTQEVFMMGQIVSVKKVMENVKEETKFIAVYTQRLRAKQQAQNTAYKAAVKALESIMASESLADNLPDKIREQIDTWYYVHEKLSDI